MLLSLLSSTRQQARLYAMSIPMAQCIVSHYEPARMGFNLGNSNIRLLAPLKLARKRVLRCFIADFRIYLIPYHYERRKTA